ncbi:SAM-dependent methyltransferase [Mesorhizobium sp. f-mel]
MPLAGLWGHVVGAETLIAMLNEILIQVDLQQCRSESINKDLLFARFRSPSRLWLSRILADESGRPR